VRALGNGDQRHPMGRKAWERLYVFLDAQLENWITVNQSARNLDEI